MKLTEYPLSNSLRDQTIQKTQMYAVCYGHGPGSPNRTGRRQHVWSLTARPPSHASIPLTDSLSFGSSSAATSWRRCAVNVARSCSAILRVRTSQRQYLLHCPTALLLRQIKAQVADAVAEAEGKFDASSAEPRGYGQHMGEVMDGGRLMFEPPTAGGMVPPHQPTQPAALLLYFAVSACPQHGLRIRLCMSPGPNPCDVQARPSRTFRAVL